MSVIQTRIERLRREMQQVSWRPDTVFLTGQDGEYTLEIREWNGVPSSARDDPHSRSYSFTDKGAALAFVEEMMAYWRERFGIERGDILWIDCTIPTDAERKSVCKRPLALEVIAQSEGKTLVQKLREVYGADVNLDDLPVWGDILRWDAEDHGVETAAGG